MSGIKGKPRLTVDIGPLLETHWTGIPVFTRRVVQALMSQDDIKLDFAYDLVKIPHAQVYDAILANSGGFLRDSYERGAGQQFPLVDRMQPIFYPSVKQHTGELAREASTVHDLSTLLMPENHEEANIDYHLKNLSAELSSNEVVFCVSEATRQALIMAFPSAAAKARLLYQYADWPADFQELDRNLPKPAIGRYAAVIGTLEPRKNLILLVNALAEPKVRDSEVRLVVIGRKGWKVDAFLAQLTPEQQSRILFSGFVTEFTKYRLLRHCEFLIFPSLYEGFGIPALEAMVLGKPVLASMTSSFPEVIGPAGVYFDPFSATDFAEGFDELSHAAKQAELHGLAIAHAATFNRDRMRNEIIRWVHEG